SWFPKGERGLATGVSTLFMLLGMLLGTALSMILWTAPLYGDPGFTVALAQANVESILYLDVILAVILTVAFFAVARDKPPQPPDIDVLAEATGSIRRMLKDRNVWFISVGFFAGFGIFIGLTAIIEELLVSLGLPVTAGLGSPAIVMVLLLVFGIIGAIVVPAISDKVQKRKPFLMVSLIVGIIATWIVGTSTVLEVTYLSSAILGFFLIAVMPIALSMLEEFKTVGPELSGASTGLAFWFGNHHPPGNSESGNIVLLLDSLSGSSDGDCDCVNTDNSRNWESGGNHIVTK
ncbi:MAG: MFS transporter, partial [Candidatus Thorarchaeota archaeon]